MLRRAPSSSSAVDDSGGPYAARPDQDQTQPPTTSTRHHRRKSVEFPPPRVYVARDRARVPRCRMQFAVVPAKQRPLDADAAACAGAAARSANQSRPANRRKLVRNVSGRTVARRHRSRSDADGPQLCRYARRWQQGYAPRPGDVARHRRSKCAEPGGCSAGVREQRPRLSTNRQSADRRYRSRSLDRGTCHSESMQRIPREVHARERRRRASTQKLTTYLREHPRLHDHWPVGLWNLRLALALHCLFDDRRNPLRFFLCALLLALLELGLNLFPAQVHPPPTILILAL